MSVHRDIRQRHKVIYFTLFAMLLLFEFRAIRKDRTEAQNSLQRMKQAEDARLDTLLGNDRLETKQLLNQENKSLDAVLKKDEAQFTRTLNTIVAAHRDDERQFSTLLDREQRLNEAQRDMSEQFAGRLVPGNTPTPPNSCDDHPQASEAVHEGAVTVIAGDNTFVEEKFPATLLRIGSTPVITLDRSATDDPHSVVLGLDFRDNKNRIVLRIDRNGTVLRTSQLIMLHPNKSTLLLEDQFGNEFMRASYLNPSAFEIQGSGIYCGRVFRIQMDLFSDACMADTGRGGTDIHIMAPACATQQ